MMMIVDVVVVADDDDDHDNGDDRMYSRNHQIFLSLERRPDECEWIGVSNPIQVHDSLPPNVWHNYLFSLNPLLFFLFIFLIIIIIYFHFFAGKLTEIKKYLMIICHKESVVICTCLIRFSSQPKSGVIALKLSRMD